MILYSKTMLLMGNKFVITVLEKNEKLAFEHIEAAVNEIKRIEALLTTYNEISNTAIINKNAGIAPVQVEPETLDIIERANKISKLTNGAFDISYGSLDKRFWNFDKTMTELPNNEVLKKSVQLIDYRNIIINKEKSTVFLKKKGMRIGFGGIGKGYAADKAKSLLQSRGVSSGIVNASGDLITWGVQPNGKPWTIALANPDNTHEAFSSIDISGMAVATSGNYEKCIIIGGKKYSHTIDPSTGFPISGIKSVTIICPIAELADAMATPIAVLGVTKGLGIINQMQNIACVIIDDYNTVFTSNNINIC